MSLKVPELTKDPSGAFKVKEIVPEVASVTGTGTLKEIAPVLFDVPLTVAELEPDVFVAVNT